MRERFTATTAALLDTDPRLAVILADIGVAAFAGAADRYPDRVVNVGIREQLMVSVAAGFALAGFRPIIHSYTPFVVERPLEQLKLDLGHQDLGAVVVSTGASYDGAPMGRTHQAPEDVAILGALPGWTIHVPGHPDEAETLLRTSVAGTGRAYLRLTEQRNAEARDIASGQMLRIRHGRNATVIAVGPLLDAVLAATADLDVTVLYATTVRPFDGATLRATLDAPAVVLVEPYQAGTSSAAVSLALNDIPHRLLAIGVPNAEHRRYGTWQEHNAAHGLDAGGIGRQVRAFLGASVPRRKSLGDSRPGPPKPRSREAREGVHP